MAHLQGWARSSHRSGSPRASGSARLLSKRSCGSGYKRLACRSLHGHAPRDDPPPDSSPMSSSSYGASTMWRHNHQM